MEADAHTIGARVRQVRNAHRKSLRVVAGLAGTGDEDGGQQPNLNHIQCTALARTEAH